MGLGVIQLLHEVHERIINLFLHDVPVRLDHGKGLAAPVLQRRGRDLHVPLIFCGISVGMEHFDGLPPLEHCRHGADDVRRPAGRPFPVDDFVAFSAGHLLLLHAQGSRRCGVCLDNGMVPVDDDHAVSHALHDVFEVDPRALALDEGGLQFVHEPFIIQFEEYGLFHGCRHGWRGLFFFLVAEYVLDGLHKLSRRKGFDEVPGHAEPAGERLVFPVEVGAGVENYRDILEDIVLPDLPEQPEAVHARHEDVGDHEIIPAGLELFQTFLAVPGNPHGVVSRHKDILENTAGQGVIVDNEYLSHGHRFINFRKCSTSRGLKDLPPPFRRIDSIFSMGCGSW